MRLETPLCNFGWQAPPFSLHDPGGKPFSLPDMAGRKGLLIAFICNHCPYVVAVADRLAQDTGLLIDEGFAVLAIMSNDYTLVPADAPPEMARFAAQHGFRFPYLVDESQSTGKAYGAVCTPDFFGFNARLELQYRGRLDDAGRGSGEGRNPELLQAMRRIGLTGQGPHQQVASMGCSIKWR